MTKKKVKVSVENTEVPSIVTENPPELKLNKNDIIDIIYHNLKTDLTTKHENISNDIHALNILLGKDLIIPKMIKATALITKELNKTIPEYTLTVSPYDTSTGINVRELDTPNSEIIADYIRTLINNARSLDIVNYKHRTYMDIRFNLHFKLIDIEFVGTKYITVEISDSDRKIISKYSNDISILTAQRKLVEKSFASIGDKSSIKARLNMSIAKGSSNGADLAQNISNLTNVLLADITPRLPG